MHSISNINSKFLLAAQQGNIDKLKKFLTAGVNVNVDSNKETALHLSARNGRSDAIRILVNAGADVTLCNSDNLTASQIAYSENNQDIGKLLDFISLAYKAEKFAKDVYEPTNDWKDLIEYRDLWKKKFDNLQGHIISNIKDIYKNKPQINIKESTIYALRLAELFVATKVAIDTKQNKGLCAEMSRASYCYLLTQIKEKDLFNIVQIHIVSKENRKISHSFIVFNLSCGAQLNDLTTWGNAIVCDSSHNRKGPAVYFVENAPLTSAIALIENESFYITNSFDRRPRINGKVARLLNDYWSNWIAKISQLYINTATPLHESSINAPFIETPRLG